MHRPPLCMRTVQGSEQKEGSVANAASLGARVWVEQNGASIHVQTVSVWTVRAMMLPTQMFHVVGEACSYRVQVSHPSELCVANSPLFVIVVSSEHSWSSMLLEGDVVCYVIYDFFAIFPLF